MNDMVCIQMGFKIGFLCTYPELCGQMEAGKCSVIVVVLSFNDVPGYDQIEVDSLFIVSG